MHKSDNLSFCVINFQSIWNKKTDLHNLIVSSEPDIILGNETQRAVLDAEILPYNIPPQHKYRLFRKDRKELVEKGGGGVIVMTKPGLNCEECPDLDSECEIKWVKVKTSKASNILFGAFYREPKSPIETLNELENSLCKIENNKKYRNCKIFLGGDFNLGDIDWERGNPISGAKDKSHCKKLCSILNSYYLEPIYTLPTRMNRNLDLFITSHPSLIERCSTGPPLGLSDHDCLFVSSKLQADINKKPGRIVHDYRKADWKKIERLDKWIQKWLPF